MSALPFKVTSFAMAFALLAACATAGEETTTSEAPTPGPEDAGGFPDVDGGVIPSDAGEDVSTGPLCSPDGWCPTTMPGVGTMWDVWPFENRAFALLSGSTFGVKAAEWTSDRDWQLISKGIQFPSWNVPRTIWAPNEDEVWFSVDDLSSLSGGSDGVILVHGRRTAPPETQWTWVTSRIQCVRALGGTMSAVWGTSRENVYVLACEKIHRLDSSAQELAWTEEYAVNTGDGGADVDAYPIALNAIGGTGPDDIWFAGSRSGGQCLVLIHKTNAGYEKVVDGVPAGASCAAIADQPGLPVVNGSFQYGLLAPAKNTVVGGTGSSSPSAGSRLVKATITNGRAEVSTSNPTSSSFLLSSPWGTSEDELFFLAEVGSSVSTVMRGSSVWGSNPQYGYSALAINGVPNANRLYTLRGTSNQNIWAVGTGHAYHKTTP